MPDFDDELWKKVYTDSVAHIKKNLDFPIMANDMSPAALRISAQNATAAGVENMIEFLHGDFTHMRPEGENGLVFFNPPYGERLKESDIDRLYARIGDHLKKAYMGFDAWIISGNLDAMKKIGLKSSQKITIFNGKIETRFVKFGLYSGSKKIKTSE